MKSDDASSPTGKPAPARSLEIPRDLAIHTDTAAAPVDTTPPVAARLQSKFRHKCARVPEWIQRRAKSLWFDETAETRGKEPPQSRSACPGGSWPARQVRRLRTRAGGGGGGGRAGEELKAAGAGERSLGSDSGSLLFL